MSGLATNLKRILHDPNTPTSLSARFRGERWSMVLEEFPDLAQYRVLDIGGTEDHWRQAPVLPAEVVLLNLEVAPTESSQIRAVAGDACDPPDELADEEFDLVYSNSVIEHVGGFVPRIKFADSVHRFAPRHWVQTPYRYFPVEPHWMFPGFQFLPPAARARAASHWPLKWSQPTGRANVGHVLSIELLSRTEMEYHFPSSRIVDERVLGLCKSLIAVGNTT